MKLFRDNKQGIKALKKIQDQVATSYEDEIHQLTMAKLVGLHAAEDWQGRNYAEPFPDLTSHTCESFSHTFLVASLCTPSMLLPCVLPQDKSLSDIPHWGDVYALHKKIDATASKEFKAANNSFLSQVVLKLEDVKLELLQQVEKGYVDAVASFLRCVNEALAPSAAEFTSMFWKMGSMR